MLRRQKVRKQKIKLVADKFNHKPLKPDWILLAIDLQLLEPHDPLTQPPLPPLPPPPPAEDSTAEAASTDTLQQQQAVVMGPGGVTAEAVAQFLRTTPLLGKAEVGEFISKGPDDLFPFNAAVRREYVKTFEFTGELRQQQRTWYFCPSLPPPLPSSSTSRIDVR